MLRWGEGRARGGRIICKGVPPSCPNLHHNYQSMPAIFCIRFWSKLLNLMHLVYKCKLCTIYAHTGQNRLNPFSNQNSSKTISSGAINACETYAKDIPTSRSRAEPSLRMHIHHGCLFPNQESLSICYTARCQA